MEAGDTAPSLYSRDGRRKYTTRSERTRVLAGAVGCDCPQAGTLALMLILTGCRLSEALALTSASINADECFVSFRSLKKRGRTIVREVPLPGWFVGHLAAVHDLRDPSARLWPYGRTWGWTLVKRIMRESEVTAGPHACPKGLRHGMAVYAVCKGVPITFIRRWLGHARLSTTEIYLDAIGPEEREVATRMWDDDRILLESPSAAADEGRPGLS